MAQHFGDRSPFVAIGTFDGVHRGHRAVLQTMVQAARLAKAPAVVLTFVPHPLTILRPEEAPPLLMSYEQRAELLCGTGAEALVELPFNGELAHTSPATFVQRHLCQQARARRVFVGADFSFGARGAGRPETLAVLGRQACGLETTVVPLLESQGLPISSTRIRQALREGRPALAARLLGGPFSPHGEVRRGRQLGAELGFPTANLVPPTGVVCPEQGVYAAWGRTLGPEGPGPWRPAVANLGRRPTVDGENVVLEVHLLGFSGDLYGQRLEVAFLRRLRGERRFPNVDALRAQIGRDAARAATILEHSPWATAP